MLTVARSAIALIVAEAARAHPAEACGLLLGAGEAISEARACTNVAADPMRHFEIDPAALIAALKAERSGGPRVIGYWHSHPTGHPAPSATDCAHAGGDGRVWAIVGSGAGGAAAADAIGWYRDAPEGFTALSTRVVEG